MVGGMDGGGVSSGVGRSRCWDGCSGWNGGVSGDG